jgi:hypothetical protein
VGDSEESRESAGKFVGSLRIRPVSSLRDSIAFLNCPGASVPGFQMPPPFDFAQGRLSRLELGKLPF